MKIPYPYQIAAIERGIKSNLLLADDCGLGKTFQAISIGLDVMRRFNQPVLIVAPKTVIAQWVQEINPDRTPVLVLDSDFVFSKPISETGKFFVLIHYEALVKHIDWLKKTFWGLVVLDEAHKIKNRQAKRSKAVKKLVSRLRLALTATPFNRDLAEYWSILNYLAPLDFSSYWKFIDTYLDMEQDALGYYHANGPKDPKAFASMLNRYVLKRTKEQVAPDLPEKIITHIPITLSNDQAALYDQVLSVDDIDLRVINTATGELTEHQITIMLTHILRLQQAASNPMLLGSNAASSKLEWVNDWLEANPDESVIIFTKFKDTARAIYNFGCECLYTGDQQIGDPKSANRIVGTIAKLGTGLDLPHINNAIFIESDWSSIQMTQAIDRIHRLGIQAPKHIMYLDALNTVDQMIRTVLDNNETTADLVNRFLMG